MKKKKEKTSEDILARAEKLFERGNYPLAQKEFEKAQKKLTRNDIAEKISMCRKKAEAMKAKEFVKRARKAEKKGDLKTALNRYEAAAPICSEDWIADRIDKLRRCLTGKNAAIEALTAETAGDFQRAAEFYARACEIEASERLVLKRAGCLVKAAKYPEAVAVLKDVSTTDPGVSYDHGLALAKTGRYLECLKIWEGLDDKNGLLAEQKRTVCKKLAAELYDRFAEKKGYPAIFNGAHYLLHLSGREWAPDQLQSLENLREYCRYAWIEDLWDEEAFETVAELLDPAPPSMGSDLLALHAKTGFKLAAHDSKHLCDMLPFWLTAVYSIPIVPGGGEAEKVRHKLIEAAEGLIKQHADTPDGKQAAVDIEIEKELIRVMADLIEKQENRPRLLCTPLYASRMGKSDEILTLIRSKRDCFKDRKTYLETGAYYSPAGKSLYLLKNKRFEEAMGLVADIEQGAQGDDFIEYAAERVHFEFGVHCLENGESQVVHYFKSTPELFETAPDLERGFTDKVLAVEEWENLAPYENVLMSIYEKRASDVVRQALSLVMTRRAVAAFNNDHMTLKALKAVTVRALKICPENEMARATLRSTLIDLETQAVIKSFNRKKSARAGRIARDSEYPEVRNRYFDFVETIFENLMESDIRNNQKLLYLTDVYEWATSVDPRRPVVKRMELFLNTV